MPVWTLPDAARQVLDMGVSPFCHHPTTDGTLARLLQRTPRTVFYCCGRLDHLPPPVDGTTHHTAAAFVRTPFGHATPSFLWTPLWCADEPGEPYHPTYLLAASASAVPLVSERFLRWNGTVSGLYLLPPRFLRG